MITTEIATWEDPPAMQKSNYRASGLVHRPLAAGRQMAVSRRRNKTFVAFGQENNRLIRRLFLIRVRFISDYNLLNFISRGAFHDMSTKSTAPKSQEEPNGDIFISIRMKLLSRHKKCVNRPGLCPSFDC